MKQKFKNRKNAKKVLKDRVERKIQNWGGNIREMTDRRRRMFEKYFGNFRMSDFLSDCAERIIVLEIVHRRVINRFHKFILWLGIPLHRVQDTKPNEFSRIVSEFALEYRTTRERVIQQLEKKANHRERNKTRGKMITEVRLAIFNDTEKRTTLV